MLLGKFDFSRNLQGLKILSPYGCVTSVIKSNPYKSPFGGFRGR
jgi:hypothetical protein